MALNAKNVQGAGGGNQDPIEAGSYPGRLVQIIDLGLQPQRPFQGQEKDPCQEIMLTYELVDEFMKDDNGDDIEDKPRWVSETIPFKGLYAEKAKSTLRYKALDPNEDHDGEFGKCIETPVNVLIVNNEKAGKVYNNVGGISPMRPRDAAACPELKNPSKVFDLDAPDLKIFNSFPQWVQDKIKGNLNFQGSPLQLALAKGGDAGKKDKAPKKDRKAAVPADDADDDAPDQGEDNNPY